MSRYRWTILGVGTVAQASYSAVLLGLPVLAPALRTEYELGLTQIGVVLAASNIGALATLLPWGLLADRIGERAVIAVGLAASAAALAGAAFAPSYGVLVVALTAAGAAGACVNAASGRAVLGWFAASERGLAFGIRQMAIPLGGVAAALTLPPVTGAAGVPAALLVLAGGCLAAGLAAAAALREAPPGPEEPLADLVHPLRDGRIWRVSAGSSLIVVAQLSILGFLVLFLHDERGLSTAAAAGVLAAIQVAGAALRVVAGAWSDRTGERVRPLVRLAVSLSLALVLAAALADAYLALTLLAFIVAGSLSQSWNGLSFTAVAELAGRARAGAALGIQQTSLTVAGAATPPVFAALVAATSWRIGFAAAALLPVAGAVVLRLVDREV